MISDWLKKFFFAELVFRSLNLDRFYHFAWALWGKLSYRQPREDICVIGITGTKGKTTVIEALSFVLESAGKKIAVLSSIKEKIGDIEGKNTTDNTMPGRAFVHRFIRDAKKADCGYVLVEVTSQGIVMSRHRFIDWNVGLITNLAPEHIEAHGSFDNYRKAKFNFLKYIARKGGGVFVNGDDDNSKFFIDNLDSPSIFSKHNLPKEISGDSYLLSSEFNRENAAAVYVLARRFGIPGKIIISALNNFVGVSGRMELLKKEPFRVVVDYAHTPDSLEKVYQTLSSNKKKNLICVLGSAGGGRDKWKRPVMGKIASKYCRDVVLTDEDPYDENPQKIIKEIRSGMNNFSGRLLENIDRRSAIREGIKLANDGDVVVITGKGSETSIHIAGGKKIPWSDKGIILDILGK